MKLWDFRKFKSKEDGEAGVVVNFHKGLNALIGENDAGKTAIIDAIKLVLQTQSGEYARVSDDDFYTDTEGNSVTEFRIDCVFEEFTINEAKNFIECLNFEKAEDCVKYKLFLHFRAWKEGRRIFTEVKAGNGEEGIVLDGKVRELLKCVYLRPLRDAAKEMSSGRNSRISQILYNHPVFRDKEENELVRLLSEANDKIEKYFLEEDGKEVLGKIRDILHEFLEENESSNATLKTSGMKLKSILESLSLLAPEVQPGLGVHNLLFIAAEMLLLNHDENGSLKLALIEELEAHLHPQAQLRLIDYLQKEYNDAGIQIIISTHSTILTSKINVKNIIFLKDNCAYDLSPEKTKLAKGDYLFLQRFLDVTKSNLFFAKGIIMVEGDAENLFIPALADLLGLNLEKHGVSIVNVGNIGFFRYSNIFVRADGKPIGVPISIVTDCDVEPEYNEDEIFEEKLDETKDAIARIESNYNNICIKAFVAPRWTFEYTIAMSKLRNMLHESIRYAKKIENSEEYALTVKKIEDVDKDVKSEEKTWDGLSESQIAYKLYHDLMLNKKSGRKAKTTSKAIVAQCMAGSIRWSITKIDAAGKEPLTKDKMFDMDLYQTEIDVDKCKKLKEEIESDCYLKYLVDAIKHAIGDVKNGN